MWPFKKKQKDSDAAVYMTDAIISRAFMGNQEAWEKILNDKSQTLHEAVAGTAMSCTIIHRWGEKSEKEECLASYHFLDFAISKHASSNSLPNILDDDRLWEVTQDIVRECVKLQRDSSQLPSEVKKYVDDANKGSAVHEGSLLAAMMNPISEITSKAKEITVRLS